MPVGNLWSLQPGECTVAEELSQRGFDVYFPVHDTGIDLLAVRGTEHIGIQVKESRYYPEHKRKSGHKGHSWHQIYERSCSASVQERTLKSYELNSKEKSTSRTGSYKLW